MFLDEFSLEKIKIVEVGLKDDELQIVKELGRKVLDLLTEFMWFDNVEVIRIILSHVRDNYIVLDKPYPITKEIIFAITDLSDSGGNLVKKSILNREVKALTSMKGDQWALIINMIINYVLRYAAYGISYKVYFKNREGATLTIVVYMAYMFVMENRLFELCEFLR